MGKVARKAGLERLPESRIGRHAGSQQPLGVLLLLLCAVTEVRGQERQCRLPCECPADPPTCAPGVPPVLDGCSCCLTCARQRGESCSEVMPCDESAGLYCDSGAGSKAGGVGVCMDLEGDNCVFDGIIYQSGETFQPNCKYHCTCRDGQIGCVPRCNVDLLLPGPDCPFPRKIEVPKECCEQWSCDPKEDDIRGLAMVAFRREATLGADAPDSGLNCLEQTTEWSACSASCGRGASTRITSKNPNCEMVKEVRLCEVRPCANGQLPEKKGKKCLRSIKAPTALHLEFKNCTSIQRYKPRYCGICSDGRCCTPHSTRTVQVEFRCPQGNVVQHPVMFISTCLCHGNCPRDNSAVEQAARKYDEP